MHYCLIGGSPMNNWRVLLLSYVIYLLLTSSILDLLRILLLDILFGKKSPQKRCSLHRAQTCWRLLTLSYLPVESDRHQRAFGFYRRVYQTQIVLLPIVLLLLFVVGFLNMHLSLLLTWVCTFLQLVLYVSLRLRFDSNRVSCYRE